MPAMSGPTLDRARARPRALCLRAVMGAAVLVTTAWLAPATAFARRPTVATDAFYVGMDIAPGVSLTGAWDLDVYLTRDRMLSVGPGVALAVLSGEEPAGQQYDLLLAVDVVRLKIGVNEPGNAVRPWFMVGGGFYYVQFPEEVVSVTGSTGDPMDDPVTVSRTLAEDEEFGGLVSFGFGVDVFVDGPWGVTLAGINRVRISETDRLPEISAELLLGVRFGL